MMNMIHNDMNSHSNIVEKTMENLQNHIYTACIMVNQVLQSGNNIILFGNGKNALLAELISSNLKDKYGLEKRVTVLEIAQNPDDEKVFENQVSKVYKKGDLLIGISISGNSVNVLRALSLGRNLECKTIGFSGYDGGAMNEFCDLNLVVPSDEIWRITEVQLLLGNIICKGIT